MKAPSDTLLLRRGETEPPDEPLRLIAGRVEALLDGIDVRVVTLDGVEHVRRLYVAVRDLTWDTVSPVVADRTVRQDDDSFDVTFTARHRGSGGIDFRWSGSICGTSGGHISYELDGLALSAFAFSRIGLCVHHPDDECAGQRFSGEGPAGRVAGTLPRRVGRQRLEPGGLHGLFPPVTRLSTSLRSGGATSFEFEGDLFEMEDQRNWTDASFKTYCTPLATPLPQVARDGDRMTQRVTIMPGAARSGAARRKRPLGGSHAVEVRIGRPAVTASPTIGTCLTDAAALSEPLVRARIVQLGLAHLRVDVRSPFEGGRELRQAARRLDVPLELAIFTDEETVDAAADVVAQEGLALARVLVFDARAVSPMPGETTPPALVEGMRRALADRGVETSVGGGTDHHFCELNRTRPRPALMDVVAFPVTPQVHANDEMSIVENLGAQRVVVQHARSMARGKAIAVTPVTLRPRYNHELPFSAPSAEPAVLPANADARQPTLFAGAWTLATIASLATGGASSITLHEATGARGLLESPGDRSFPEPTPAVAGQVFPVYHALSMAARVTGARLRRSVSAEPRRIAALAVEPADDGSYTVLLANLTNSIQPVHVRGLGGDAQFVALDETTASAALREPQALAGTAASAVGDRVRIVLLPYAFGCIEGR